MRKANSIYGIALLTALTLAGCGGGGGSSSAAVTPTPTPAPQAPTLGINFALKQLQFSWSSSSDATTYKLMENPDGVSGFTQVGTDIPAPQVNANQDIAVHKLDWAHAQYLVQACNAGGCTNSNTVTATAGVLKTIGYFKASNTDSNDQFGYSVAISADGSTLAIGAQNESSAATGVNGGAQAEANNSATDAGAVYVFSHDSGSWVQQAYVKAPNADAYDGFGTAVALNADGNTLAVGSPYEDSNSAQTQSDNTAIYSGAVYIYKRANGAWSWQAYVKEATPVTSANFGTAVTLSNDGNTLAAGAPGASNSLTGTITIFSQAGATWIEQAHLQASNAGGGDQFGYSVALSGDGNTVAVGAPYEGSSLTGINNPGTDNNNKAQAGAVYVFARNNMTWNQQAYIKASAVKINANFGNAVALSSNGDTLAVGVPNDSSAAVGINGDPSTSNNASSGAAYVYSRTNSAWSQQAYIKPAYLIGDGFGYVLALSGDGNTLAIGAPYDSSAATGINGNETDHGILGAGAAYLFKRSTTNWSQQSYVKAPTTNTYSSLGFSIALSSDSNTLAIGAPGEFSSATGVGGDQTDNSKPGAGAVNLY